MTLGSIGSARLPASSASLSVSTICMTVSRSSSSHRAVCGSGDHRPVAQGASDRDERATRRTLERRVARSRSPLGALSALLGTRHDHRRDSGSAARWWTGSPTATSCRSRRTSRSSARATSAGCSRRSRPIREGRRRLGADAAVRYPGIGCDGRVPGRDGAARNRGGACDGLEQSRLTYTIVWSLALANVLGAGLCIVLARPIARLTTVPFNYLAPFMIVAISFAAFQATRDLMDLVALLGVVSSACC